MPSFLNPEDAHFWVAIALVVFVLILWRAKVPGMVTGALDAAGERVQSQLDEAARLRAEAAQVLADIKRDQHEAAEEGGGRNARHRPARGRASAR